LLSNFRFVLRHSHYPFDGLAFCAAVKRRLHIVRTLDWAANQRTKFFMTTLNHLARRPTVLREESLAEVSEPHRLFTQASRRCYQINALRQSVDLLKAERVVVIFPEGYPNVDPHFTPKKSNDEFLPFKAGFSAIAESAERSLDKAIPLIPVGIGYEIGEPWIARLNFGPAVYRRDFSSRQSLIALLELEIRQLSAATSGYREIN